MIEIARAFLHLRVKVERTLAPFVGGFMIAPFDSTGVTDSGRRRPRTTGGGESTVVRTAMTRSPMGPRWPGYGPTRETGCACEGVRETQGRFECPECGLDDNADKNGALNIGKRALGKFSKPLSEAGAVLARPETQIIVQRDDEPVNLPLLVDSTSSGGTPRL